MTENYEKLLEYAALGAALDDLARARADLDEKQAALDALKAELMPYEGAVKKAKEAERTAYEAATAATLAVKDAHGDLTPIPKVAYINIVQKPVYDEQAVMLWAVQERRYDLLDMKVKYSEVLRALREGELIPGASLSQEFQPHIATKLGDRLLVKRDVEGGENG